MAEFYLTAEGGLSDLRFIAPAAPLNGKAAACRYGSNKKAGKSRPPDALEQQPFTAL
jgi:hypothetical protein